jgi:hypothetical protein
VGVVTFLGVEFELAWDRLAIVARRLVLGASLMSTPVGAQQSQAEAQRLTCFRISSLPTCRGYWLVEVQGVTPLASTKQTDAFRGSVDVFDDNNLEFNLGYMLNLSGSGQKFDDVF